MNGKKLSDLDVVPVLFPLQVVLNQNQLLVRGAVDSIELSVRSSFFNPINFYVVDTEPRKMHSRSSKQQRGCHNGILDVQIAIDSADRFLGADNTTVKLRLGSNL